MGWVGWSGISLLGYDSTARRGHQFSRLINSHNHTAGSLETSSVRTLPQNSHSVTLARFGCYQGTCWAAWPRRDVTLNHSASRGIAVAHARFPHKVAICKIKRTTILHVHAAVAILQTQALSRRHTSRTKLKAHRGSLREEIQEFPVRRKQVDHDGVV